MIQFERRIAASPETVFAYFTDPALYTAWMGVEAELDARPGGLYRVRVPQGHVARGEFVEVDPPRRVSFTWGWEGDPVVPPGSTRVIVTLTRDGTDTVLRLVHEGLPDQESQALHEQGWDRYLGRLVPVAAGEDPGREGT